MGVGVDVDGRRRGCAHARVHLLAQGCGRQHLEEPTDYTQTHTLSEGLGKAGQGKAAPVPALPPPPGNLLLFPISASPCLPPPPHPPSPCPPSFTRKDHCPPLRPSAP